MNHKENEKQVIFVSFWDGDKGSSVTVKQRKE